MNLPACIAILGPTCCWKSEVAVRIAELLGGEIVSCDSMQVYRHLDIGTAKPSADDMRRVPHHLVDMLELSEPYDANRFVKLAGDALGSIRSRDHVAVMAGGTGLYARALIYGFNMLPAEPEVFKRYEAECGAPGGKDRLVALLEDAARKQETIVPDDCKLNPRRVMRACEVLELTGQLPWVLQKKNETPAPGFKQFCIVPVLADIKERIRLRTSKMLEAGWIEEALHAEAEYGLMATPTARQALGYGDILAWHREGRPGGVPALCELLGNRTIQYARRQLTWFKHQHPGAIMLEPPSIDGAADWIFERVRSSVSL